MQRVPLLQAPVSPSAEFAHLASHFIIYYFSYRLTSCLSLIASLESLLERYKYRHHRRLRHRLHGPRLWYLRVQEDSTGGTRGQREEGEGPQRLYDIQRRSIRKEDTSRGKHPHPSALATRSPGAERADAITRPSPRCRAERGGGDGEGKTKGQEKETQG
jgi:hypothetical protein